MTQPISGLSGSDWSDRDDTEMDSTRSSRPLEAVERSKAIPGKESFAPGEPNVGPRILPTRARVRGCVGDESTLPS